MRSRLSWGWLGLLAGVVWAASAGPGRAQHSPARPDAAERARSAAQVPLDQLPPHVRDGARRALERPTFFSRGPAEVFACDPSLYYWFLDHPDRAVTAWRKLGAKCLNITSRGQGRFGWTDENGSDIVWETVYREPNLRIWYAEGKVRVAALLPLVPVRAVVVLRHAEAPGLEGKARMHHQADLFLRTDSAAASLAAKLLGPSAPRVAEQNLAQLQMFFAGLAWYCHRYPDRAEALFTADPNTPAPGQAPPPRGRTGSSPAGN
jgi:hypothetical protein